MPLPANQLIRHARRRAGRSRQEVADLAGVPESIVFHFELGRRIPTWDQLQQLVLACGFWLDVRLRELRPALSSGWPPIGPVGGGRGGDPDPVTTPGVDLDAAAYLCHRLRSVREELAAMASSLEAVAESFKDDEWRHYERFSHLVVSLSASPIDQALASLERELRVVRAARGRRRGGQRRLRTACVDLHACDRLADRVAHARHRVDLAVTRLRAERLDEMAYTVELQGRELAEIERTFRVCLEDIDAAG